MPELEKNCDLVKSHIDKLYSTLQKYWDLYSRIFISLIILSVVLVGISSGALSNIDKISASGINITVSVYVLVSAAIFGITILLGALSAVDFHCSRLSDEIIRLYKSLNYSDDGLLDRTRSPFEGPNVILSTLYNAVISLRTVKNPLIVVNAFLGGLTATATIVLLPIGSQIAGSIWLAAHFGWHWLAITGSLVCIITTLVTIVAGFTNA